MRERALVTMIVRGVRHGARCFRNEADFGIGQRRNMVEQFLPEDLGHTMGLRERHARVTRMAISACRRWPNHRA
jgi:hypothetical protein